MLGAPPSDVPRRGPPLRARRDRAISTTARSRRTRSQLDGVRVWPLDDGRPPSSIHTRDHERQARLVFGSCRVGDPERPPYTLSRTRTPRGSGSTRCGRSRDACRPAASSGPTACCCWAIRCTRTRCPTRDAGLHPRHGATSSQPPGGQVADFEEYARLYQRGVERPGHPLAAGDGAEHDGLRRPRRPRRLEHLRRLGGRDMRRDAVVGGAHRRRVHGVLDLPAPRQPGPARAGRGAAASPSSRGDDDGGPRLRAFARASRPRVGGQPVGPTTATSGARGCVVIDSRAARVLADGRRDMVDDEEWQLDRRACPRATTTTSSSRAPCRSSWPPGIDALEAWNEAVCSGAWGRLRRARRREATARRSTWSTGPRSSARSGP